jgi:hypothetical protein
MQIVLMHKDDLVARLAFTEAGYFTGIEGFYNKQLMPPGTRVSDSLIEQKFRTWMRLRSISKDRKDYNKLITKLNIKSSEQLYLRNYGLGLNDCYWIKPYESINNGFSWSDINLFKNLYSDYVGNFLLDPYYNSYCEDFLSPDLTTNGNSIKMWIQNEVGKESYLLKKGNQSSNEQEPYNEVIASLIAKRLGVNYVDYVLIDKKMSNGSINKMSMCKNFCNENIEFIDIQTLMMEPNLGNRNSMLKYIKQHNLKDELDKILIFDYLIMNRRNMEDLGFLRDANTMYSLGMAPVFDNGNSLCFDWKTIPIGTNDESKTFEFTHEKQIEIVDNFSWIDFSSLDGIEFDIKEIFKDSRIPSDVQDKICQVLRVRIKKLYKISREKRNKIYIENKTQKDIENFSNKLSKPSNGFGV